MIVTLFEQTPLNLWFGQPYFACLPEPDDAIAAEGAYKQTAKKVSASLISPAEAP
jgi:hypothetical protein